MPDLPQQKKMPSSNLSSLVSPSPMSLMVTAGLIGLSYWWWSKRIPANRKIRQSGAEGVSLGARGQEVPKADLDKLFATLHKNFDANATHAIHDPKRWDYEWRLQQLYALRDMYEENLDAFLEAAKQDIGRKKSEFVLESGANLADLDHIIAGLKTWMTPSKRTTPLWMMPASSYVISEPVGVCLILGTWNYAAVTSLLPLAGAIAAGNAAILKPSELAPAQSELMARLIPKYLDPTAYRVVQGGVETAKTLVDSYEWGMVFYTGGSKVGASIAASCSSRLIPCCLELGGKSPTIILEDADLLVTCRRIVQGKFVNSGQTCIAPDYVVIVGNEARQKEVLAALIKEVQTQYPGDVLLHPEYARVVNEKHYARVESLLKSGGKVLLGGKCFPEHRCIEPTIIVDCHPDSAILSEEIFGPLLPVVGFPDADEAIAYIRSKPKPLTLYVFSSNQKKADYVLSRTSSGSACVNEAVFQFLNPGLPFGGIGPSGSGAYHGEASFREFSHQKSIVYRSTFADLPIRYLPHVGEEWVQRLFTFLLRA